MSPNGMEPRSYSGRWAPGNSNRGLRPSDRASARNMALGLIVGASFLGGVVLDRALTSAPPVPVRSSRERVMATQIQSLQKQLASYSRLDGKAAPAVALAQPVVAPLPRAPVAIGATGPRAVEAPQPSPPQLQPQPPQPQPGPAQLGVTDVDRELKSSGGPATSQPQIRCPFCS